MTIITVTDCQCHGESRSGVPGTSHRDGSSSPPARRQATSSAQAVGATNSAAASCGGSAAAEAAAAGCRRAAAAGPGAAAAGRRPGLGPPSRALCQPDSGSPAVAARRRDSRQRAARPGTRP
jgi:hypothetical protein